MKCKFVLCTYFWGKDTKVSNTPKNITYGQLAEKLERKCKKLGIDHDVVYKADFENRNYQLNVNYKPKFILSMLKKHKKPILYIDVDMKIHKYPLLFDVIHSDIEFAAFNWNADSRVCETFDPYIFETAGGLMYFGNTKNAMQLCSLWAKTLGTKKYMRCADDRVLALVFHKNNMLHKIKCLWIPFEYFYIPEFFKGAIKENDVVISHNHKITTEEEAAKRGAYSSRIPKEYSLDKLVKERSMVWNMNYNPALDHIMKKYLKHAISKNLITT